jgi:hypothetical protein
METAVETAEKKTEERMALVETFIHDNGALVITDQATFDRADEITSEIKKRTKKLEDEYKEIVRPINASKKRIKALFDRPIEAYENLYTMLKKKSSAYLIEQERIQKEEQARRDEAARKEKARLEKKADRQEGKGNADAADATRNIADTIVAPTVATKVEKRGTYNVEKFTAEITDPAALLKWIAENNKVEYITFNQSLLNKEAQATKGKRQWPGVKVNRTIEARHRG